MDARLLLYTLLASLFLLPSPMLLAQESLTTAEATASFAAGKSALGNNHLDSAEYFFNSALEAWTRLYPGGSLEEVQMRIELGQLLMRKEQAKASLVQGEMALKTLDALGLENVPERFRAHRVIARSYYGTGQYNKAIPDYEKAIQLATQFYGQENGEVALIMIYYSNCLNYCGLLDQAAMISERAIYIQQKNAKDIPPEQIAGAFVSLGACQQSLKKYDKALSYYKKAVEIRRKLDSPRLAYCYSKIGQIYMDNNQLDSAMVYFHKENEVLLRKGLENDPAYAYLCRDFGLVYMGLKKYDTASYWLERALAIFQSPAPGVSSSMGLDQCHLLIQTGQAYAASGHFEQALTVLQKSRLLLEQLYGADYLQIFELHAEFGITLYKYYLETHADSLLDQSRAHFRLAEKGVKARLHSESRKRSANTLLHESLQYYENAILVELEYLALHPEQKSAQEMAWQLSESMHAQLLHTSVQEANARHFAGIPDTALARDSVLRTELADLKEKRKSLAENGIPFDDPIALSLNHEIYLKNEEAETLRRTFEKKYPEYYRLKYDTQPISLEQVRQSLTPNQTLLEYFTGDSNLFVFVVRRHDTRIIRMSRDFPLNELVHQLRSSISAYHTAAAKTSELYRKSVTEYASAAQQLYEKLITPVAPILTSELIIIPSDALANLPFEALLSSAPKDLSSFKSYPFMVRDYAIQYGYSATMYQQMATRQHWNAPQKDIFAIAPFYKEENGNTSTFIPLLPFSAEEVSKICRSMGSGNQMLLGAEATKEIFLSRAAQFKVLHLATHGKANPIEGDFSYLAFAPNQANTGLLTAAELYNLPINADLVVLSACETGIGEQLRGEGVVSLARAFAYAGAKSIVASLWSVNDQSTMQIMDAFYAGLKARKPKHLALVEAKRRYLQNNTGMNGHPFFWAALVGLGDTAPIAP